MEAKKRSSLVNQDNQDSRPGPVMSFKLTSVRRHVLALRASSCNEAILHLSTMEPNKLKNDKPCVCQVFLLSHPGDGDSRFTIKR